MRAQSSNKDQVRFTLRFLMGVQAVLGVLLMIPGVPEAVILTGVIVIVLVLLQLPVYYFLGVFGLKAAEGEEEQEDFTLPMS